MKFRETFLLDCQTAWLFDSRVVLSCMWDTTGAGLTVVDQTAAVASRCIAAKASGEPRAFPRPLASLDPRKPLGRGGLNLDPVCRERQEHYRQLVRSS